MPFQTRPRRAFLAGLLLLAGPAAAQAPPPVASPPPPASMTQPANAPAVDPQVTALFQQTIAAHQALKALTATITFPGPELGKAGTRTTTLAYQKPNRAKVVVAAGDGSGAQFFSSGSTVTVYLVKNKTYQVQPVPPGTDIIPAVLDQAHTLLPHLLGHPEALNALLTQPGVTASLGPLYDGRAARKKTVAGVAVDTVIATLPAPGGGKATFTFDIGETDHLLRQVAENADFTVQTTATQTKETQISQIETVTALSANPTLTAAEFAFTPPAGVKKVAAPKAGQNPPMHDPRLVPGARPFPVAAKDLSGRPLTLAQYHGKVVLMDFWATWCGPCVGEMPNVIAAYKKYHAQGFDIVGVSLDQSRPALVSFIAENKMPWRQVFDGKYWSSAVPREYGVQAIPFGLLVGRDGKIAAVDVRGPALETAIQQALAK